MKLWLCEGYNVPEKIVRGYCCAAAEIINDKQLTIFANTSHSILNSQSRRD